jgi:hypothetical protein
VKLNRILSCPSHCSTILPPPVIRSFSELES